MKNETKINILKQKLDEMRDLYTQALNRHDHSEVSPAGAALRKAIALIETYLGSLGIIW